MPQLTMLWPRVSGASRLPLVNSGVAAMAMPACLLCFKRCALAKIYAVLYADQWVRPTSEPPF